jgi:hypothetical protein
MGADRSKGRQARFLFLLVVMKGAQAPFFLPSSTLLHIYYLVCLSLVLGPSSRPSSPTRPESRPARTPGSGAKERGPEGPLVGGG